MGLIRRLFGVIALLVGLAGLVLCIAGLGFVWFANARVKDGAQRAVEPVEESLAYIQNQLEKGGQWISAMQQRLASMHAQADQLASIDPAALESALGQVELDHEAIEYNLQRSELLVNVSRESIGTLTEFSELVEDVPQVSLGKYSKEGPLATRIQEADQHLADFTAILAQIRETMAKMRAEGEQLSPQTIEELSDRLQRAEAKLAETHDTVTKFRQSLRTASDDVTGVKEKLPEWIDTGSWVVTGILVWLGISQFALFACGQAMAKPR